MFDGIGRIVVRVGDLEEALAFYREVLGFVVLHDSEAGGFRYLHVGVPGQEGVGIWLMPAEGPRPEGPQLVLYTPDAPAVAARLRERGVEVWAEHEDAGGRSLHFRDPAGNVIVAAELAGPASVADG